MSNNGRRTLRAAFSITLHEPQTRPPQHANSACLDEIYLNHDYGK